MHARRILVSERRTVGDRRREDTRQALDIAPRTRGKFDARRFACITGVRQEAKIDVVEIAGTKPHIRVRERDKTVNRQRSAYRECKRKRDFDAHESRSEKRTVGSGTGAAGRVKRTRGIAYEQKRRKRSGEHGDEDCKADGVQ